MMKESSVKKGNYYIMQKILKFFGSFEEFDEKKVFWTAFWIAFAVMLLHILFFHKVERDAASLYAAMAREFGCGRYQYAFYPAIPPLLSVLAGCLCKIGFAPFGAIKTVAAIFFIGGLFPFRSIMTRIVNAKMAAWACIVYVCSSYMIRYSIYGYPFALKFFFLILSVYYVILFAETNKIRYSVFLGLSVGFLALSRGECIGFLPFYLLWFFALPIYFKYRHKETIRIQKLIAKQILGICLIFLCFIAVCWPQMIYVYKHTGIPITEMRTGEILEKEIDKYFPEVRAELNNADTLLEKDGKKQEKTKIAFEDKKYKAPEKLYDIESFGRSLKEAYKGLYPILIIFALFGLFFKFKKKQFTVYDLFFLSVILYNAIMFLATIPVTRRYTAVTQPFELGWVVMGGYFIYDLKVFNNISIKFRRYWKSVVGLAVTVVVIVLLINGCNRFNEYIFEGNQYYTIGEWIKQNKELFPSKKYVRINNYYTDRLPVIFAVISEYSFWADADFVSINTGYTYSINDLVGYMRAHNATVLIYDDRMREICPDFLKKNWHKNFKKVKEFSKWGIILFRLRLPYSS